MCVCCAGECATRGGRRAGASAATPEGGGKRWRGGLAPRLRIATEKEGEGEGGGGGAGGGMGRGGRPSQREAGGLAVRSPG